MNTQQPAPAVHQATVSAFDILAAWLTTPTGASLLAVALLTGGAFTILKILGRSTRIIGWVFSAAGILLFAWVSLGVAQALGVPVKPVLAAAASWLPSVIGAIGGFIVRVFTTAG